MEEQEAPPPLSSSNNNSIPHIFTGSIPSTTSILQQQPPLLLNPQQQQLPIQDTHQSIVSSDNIDWIGLLSGGSSSSSPIVNGYHQKPQLPTTSLQRSYRNNNSSEVRDHQCGGESCTARNKGKGGRSRKSVPPRIAFHTRSSEDILDDGYKWRKYGQKAVKNSKHPRSYYRCTHHTCDVKKQIQRLSKDTGIVVTTYEGIHSHPCEKLMATLSPLLRQLQFLSRF